MPVHMVIFSRISRKYKSQREYGNRIIALNYALGDTENKALMYLNCEEDKLVSVSKEKNRSHILQKIMSGQQN